MKVTVLIENTAPETLIEEWGLSLYIEHEGMHFLLDTGASGHFAENAERLGIDLKQVEAGVLSHAHNDHSDGMDVFFEINDSAPFYIRRGAGENCYTQYGQDMVYEGIPKGWLDRFASRIVYAEGNVEIRPGVWLLPHTAPDLEETGRRAHMFVERDGEMVPDDLSHEQSLVFDTENGLVIFNSCSHAGADVIVREAAEALPGRPIRAMIGGFHLFDTPEGEVRALAERLAATGVRHVITGHCTGDASYETIRSVPGPVVSYLGTGSVFSF